MSNTGIIITLAYPDTIVSHAKEWYSPYLKYLGIGNRTSVRAGHAALILINRATGILEYYDFGRYITPESKGRVRSKETDNELEIPIVAKIENSKILNIVEIMRFFATNPKLTHGEGRLVASVCGAVNYKKASSFIEDMQSKYLIRYAAFIKAASNCARFVTDCLIASVNDEVMKKKLVKSKWFTPSTIGNVLIADTEAHVFEVTIFGKVSKYKGSQKKENLKCFLDPLKEHKANNEGSLQPKKVNGLNENAQWLSGTGSGAWFEVYKTDEPLIYRYRRISPFGTVDCEALFRTEDQNFNIDNSYQFTHHSNCSFFKIEQNGKAFKFYRKTS